MADEENKEKQSQISTEETKPPSEEKNPPKEEGETDKESDDDEEEEETFGTLLKSFTSNRYYMEIIKSIVVFVIALKLARECRNVMIPMRYYKPFNMNI